MPDPFVVSLRGSREYADFLARVVVAARAAGRDVENTHQLAEVAIAELVASLGLPPLPPRARAVGTNRYGPPRPGPPDASSSAYPDTPERAP